MGKAMPRTASTTIKTSELTGTMGILIYLCKYRETSHNIRKSGKKSRSLQKNKRIFAGNTTSKTLTVMNKLLPAVFRFDGCRFYCLRAKP
jgi:hypothetical protein